MAGKPDPIPDLRLPEHAPPPPLPPPPARLPPPMEIPDMTIPDQGEMLSEKPLGPLAPAARRQAGWQVGDRVFAPWEPDFLYAGTIEGMDGRLVTVRFDDGDQGEVQAQQVYPLQLDLGMTVYCRHGQLSGYLPATVQKVDGDEVRVRFASDGKEDWVEFASLRLAVEAEGPAAIPRRSEFVQRFLRDLAPGMRVWAPFGALHLAATVEQVSEHEVDVAFDRGQRAWVDRPSVIPLLLPRGMRVYGFWKRGSQLYPASVAEVDGDQIHLHYDDGDREWTTVQWLALNDGRHASASPMSSLSASPQPQPFSIPSWLIYPLILIGLTMLRMACRTH